MNNIKKSFQLNTLFPYYLSLLKYKLLDRQTNLMMIKIYEAANGVDAHLICNLLQNEGLHARIDGEYLQGGIGDLQASGLVRVMIEESELEQGREIIHSWENYEDPYSLLNLNPIMLDNKAKAPSKIVCIGRNYVEHIKELDNEMPSQPVIFVKPNSAISDELCSGGTDAIHYEGEISFVIENSGLVAVGFGLDLTKRAVQSQLKAKGLPWERAKAFDKAAVFSEFVSFDDDVETLSMELFINGQLIQAGSTELMMLKPRQVLNEIQSFMTLTDGDIIMTGTPKGVGEVVKGDVFVGKILQDEKLLVEKQWAVL